MSDSSIEIVRQKDVTILHLNVPITYGGMCKVQLSYLTKNNKKAEANVLTMGQRIESHPGMQYGWGAMFESKPRIGSTLYELEEEYGLLCQDYMDTNGKIEPGYGLTFEDKHHIVKTYSHCAAGIPVNYYGAQHYCSIQEKENNTEKFMAAYKTSAPGSEPDTRILSGDELTQFLMKRYFYINKSALVENPYNAYNAPETVLAVHEKAAAFQLV